MIDTTSSGSFYKIPNRRVTGKSVNGYKAFMKGTYLRAPGAPQALFASEQTIDALAHAANVDPIAFRDPEHRHHRHQRHGPLDRRPRRGRKGGELEAEGLRVSKRKSGNVVTGRGVAIGGFANAFPAIVADITVNKKTGKITVDHLYAAQDAGTTVNPASVENQMEGCLVQGTSRALIERSPSTRPADEPRLDHYPILRFKDAPDGHNRRRERLDAVGRVGRANDRRRCGRDRERVLRRDRRPPLPRPDDPRLRPR